MSTLHLHHLQNSRSFRILWLLEELNLDYQLTTYERKRDFLAPKRLQLIHPTGKAPILEVDDKSLVESGHIIEYLMVKYDTTYELHPKTDADSAEWLNYNFWLHYSEGSAMPALVMRLVFNKVVEGTPTIVRPVANRLRERVEAAMISKNIDKTLMLIEHHLSDNQWFAGTKFSSADIQMAFVVEAANSGEGLDSIKYNNTLNFLLRCQSRPAYKQAVAKGGKIEF